MSQSNQEILSIMKGLSSGQSTGGKSLRFNPESKKLVLADAEFKKPVLADVLDPKTKQIIKKYTSPNDPDALPEIDPSDAIVFYKKQIYNPVLMLG